MEAKAGRTVRRAAPWLELLARLGYAMKSLVYGTIGVLALEVALRRAGATTDAQGAIAILGAGPGGTILLGAAGAGLIGYGLWRIIEAAFDLKGKGTKLKGIGARVARSISGVINITLGFYALQLLSGAGRRDSESSTDRMTASVLAMPLGQEIVIAAGIAIAAVGIYQAYLVTKPRYRERLAEEGIPERPLSLLVTSGRIGTVARSIVFVAVGFLMVRAGFTLDASESAGLRGALEALQRAPFGRGVLALTAGGFILYALYCLLAAGYRRVPLPGDGDNRGPLAKQGVV